MRNAYFLYLISDVINLIILVSPPRLLKKKALSTDFLLREANISDYNEFKHY